MMAVVVVVIISFLVLESPLLFGAVVVLEFDRLEVFMDQVHKAVPDPSRPSRSLKSPDAFRRITANPDCRRVIVREAAEPSVLSIVRRSRLACAGHSVPESQAAPGAPVFFHDALQNAHHLSGRVLIIDLGGNSVIGIDR